VHFDACARINIGQGPVAVDGAEAERQDSEYGSALENTAIIG
jgi:hypothetical protein